MSEAIFWICGWSSVASTQMQIKLHRPRLPVMSPALYFPLASQCKWLKVTCPLDLISILANRLICDFYSNCYHEVVRFSQCFCQCFIAEPWKLHLTVNKELKTVSLRQNLDFDVEEFRWLEAITSLSTEHLWDDLETRLRTTSLHFKVLAQCSYDPPWLWCK